MVLQDYCVVRYLDIKKEYLEEEDAYKKSILKNLLSRIEKEAFVERVEENLESKGDEQALDNAIRHEAWLASAIPVSSQHSRNIVGWLLELKKRRLTTL